MEHSLQSIIEIAYENRGEYTPSDHPTEVKEAVNQVMFGLDRGELRVARQNENDWHCCEWIKKAVLLSFRLNKNHRQTEPDFSYDKVNLKYVDMQEAELLEQKIRLVPGALVRKGAYIGPNTILMPSFVNTGAYVGENCLIDTWATVGSCAQIGNNVHISGGAGIGGVLEPLQATPTIIEDNCFIGARSEIVEGVIVEKNAVIGMGVFIGQSTKIYHRETGEISYGRIPENSVVVAGSLPSKDNSHHLYSAIIIKQVDDKTRKKTAINELLRD